METMATICDQCMYNRVDHFLPFFFAPPFTSAFRFKPVSSFFTPFVSVFFTVKKPSKRPCCFAESILASFAAPARTRSSLIDQPRFLPRR